MSVKCKYAAICSIYHKVDQNSKNPDYLTHNVFCKRGLKGWNACKRFHIFELELKPTDDILPGNSEPIEILVSRLKKKI